MTVTYTEARNNLAPLLDRAVEDREAITIKRRGSEDVVLIAASELESLRETAHLLRSPANARRLEAAHAQAVRGKGRAVSLDHLEAQLGVGGKKR